MPIQRATPADPSVAVTGAPPPQAADPSLSTVQLELAVHKRYTLHDGAANRTYEAGVVYRFTPEMAEFMLMRKSDLGLPIFRRYAPRAKLPVNSEGKQVMDMTSSDLPANMQALKAQDARTQAELAELANEGVMESEEGVEA